jgi:hypothetical protein
MDAEVLDAVAVVDIAPNQATEWFDLVNGAYSASSNDWDAFSRQLSSTAGSTFGTAAVTFLGYAADHGRTELIGKLVADLRELPSAYASSRSQAVAQVPPQSGGSSWDDVVRQLGSGWAGWDGSEATWPQFRDWTYTSANEQHPDMYAAAYEKLNPLNGLPLTERAAKLTELGFTVQTPAAQPPAEPVAEAGSAGVDQIIEESLAEALQEVPGSEALTPEELARMRAEIAAELASEEGGES